MFCSLCARRVAAELPRADGALAAGSGAHPELGAPLDPGAPHGSDPPTEPGFVLPTRAPAHQAQVSATAPVVPGASPASAQQGSPEQVPGPSEAHTEPSWQPSVGGRPVQAGAPLEPETVRSEVDPQNYRLSMAGNIVAGLGVGAFVGAVASVVVANDAREKRGFPGIAGDEPGQVAERDRWTRRRRVAGIAAASSAALSVGMISAGVAMITLARKRELVRRQRLGLAVWFPLFEPGLTGVQLAVRW